MNYGDYADPAALLSTLVAARAASQNYDNFNDPQITALLEQARAHRRPERGRRWSPRPRSSRRRILPWIPDVQPANLLIMSKNLTGATASFAYMFAPWANSLGGS